MVDNFTRMVLLNAPPNMALTTLVGTPIHANPGDNAAPVRKPSVEQQASVPVTSMLTNLYFAITLGITI